MKENIKTIIGFVFCLVILYVFNYVFFGNNIDDFIPITIGCTIGYWVVYFITRKNNGKK